MDNFFSADGPAMKFLTALCNLIFVNILFIIYSIPIITIGSSLSALYRITISILAGNNPSVFKEFNKSFIKCFAKSTVAWLILLAAAALFISELYICYFVLDGTYYWLSYPVIFVLCFVLAIAFYIFPLNSWFEETLKTLFKNSILIAVTNLPQTIFFIVVTGVIVYIAYKQPVVVLSLMLFIGFALIALIYSAFLKKIFENHGAVIDTRELKEEQREP